MSSLDPVHSRSSSVSHQSNGHGLDISLHDNILLHVLASEKYTENKQFIEADDEAWKAMALIGLRDFSDVRQYEPQQIAEKIDPSLYPLISRAATKLGISFEARDNDYHIRTFMLLELAVTLDPNNVQAVIQLGSNALNLTPDSLRNSFGSEGVALKEEDLNDEFLRERAFAMEALEKMLKDKFGITDENRAGKGQLPKLEGVDLIHAVWALSDLSKILLNIAIWDATQADGNKGVPFYNDALNCAKSLLVLMGLPREFEDAQFQITRLMGKDANVFGSRKPNISKAYELYGSVSQLKGDFRGAEKWHEFACQIDRKNSFARSRYEYLKNHLGVHKVVPLFDDRPSQEVQKEKVNKDKTATGKWQGQVDKVHSKIDKQLMGWVKQQAKPLSAIPEAEDILLEFAEKVAAVKSNSKDGRQTFLDSEIQQVDRWWIDGNSPDGYIKLLSVVSLSEILQKSQDSVVHNKAALLINQLDEIREVYGSSVELGVDEEIIKKALSNVAIKMLSEF